MSRAVGIDLGTTNSVVSVYRRGVVETLPVEGRTTLPSVVSFMPDGNALVGHPAKARTMLAPEQSVASAKRFMGDRDKRFAVGGKSLTPVEIASMVLTRLVDAASKALKEKVSDVVITVPAYFSEAQREDTRRAGVAAGLNVLRLVPEPTAAAIAYGLDKAKDQTLMVYDLGGGTFDVSILSVKGNSFNVIAVGGDSQLGGDDFDLAIMTWAAGKFRDQTGIDVMTATQRDAMIARQRLKELSEAAKIELSESVTTTLTAPDFMGRHLELELSREEYNRLIAPLLARTIECMRKTLADAKMTARDIDRVILVGGSTKNSAVRELVAKTIKDPFIAERVDEVVAHGAAIVAAQLFAPEEDSLPAEIEISDVTAHSLGVDILDEHDKIIFAPIIPRQTRYPCRMGILCYTNRPQQPEVQMRVFRGEDPDPDNDTFLGELSLPVNPPQQAIVPIAAIFELDADGIIQFTAVQLPPGPALSAKSMYGTGREMELDVSRVDPLILNGQARTKVVQVRSH